METTPQPDLPSTGGSAELEARPPRPWWAWPLRIATQLGVTIWVWKLYTCMQLQDCSDPTLKDRLTVHFAVALMAAFGIEVILLVNRVLDEGV